MRKISAISIHAEMGQFAKQQLLIRISFAIVRMDLKGDYAIFMF